ncbi:MAG: gamma-glutamyltransferase [Sandaracinaceae bacterium]
MRRWPPGALGALALLVRLGLLGQAPPPATDHAGAFSEYAGAADHPLASAAGAQILAQGGNAADAAAATMLALGVVSPASSGLGGGGFGLYREADGTVSFLDFRERAPGAATAEMFAVREGDDEETAATRSRAGGLAVGVPGEPAGIELLIERFGSGEVNRAQIAAPAIRYATEGFEANDRFERFSAWLAEPMRADPVWGRWFPPGADRIPAGHRIRNPAHARTLAAFARSGARPFYRGTIARAIVRAVRAHGGVMTLDDLGAYEVLTREPILGRHFGYTWVTAPPPSAGGFTVLQSLALLEAWLPEERRGEDSALLRHAFAESWKGAYLDRHLYVGDPDHVDVPLAGLIDPARGEARARVFHPTLARDSVHYAVPIPGRAEPRAARPGLDAGTSHLCVVDAEGNVASVTTTVNLPFGARFSAAGIVMNDEMDDFAREVGEQNAFGLVGGAPNLPGPGRRPVSSMAPTIVLDADGPALCVGASGGSRIPTALEQVAYFVLVAGDTPEEAIARPRVHHQGEPESLQHEGELPAELEARLAARGHRLAEMRYSAVVQAIQVDDEGPRRTLRAASDPRKGGRPAGR